MDGQGGFPGSTGTPEGNGRVGMDGQTGLPGSTGSPEGKGSVGMDGQTGLPGSTGSSGEKGHVGMNGQAGLPGSTGTPEGKGPVVMDGQTGLSGSTGSPEGNGPVVMDGQAGLPRSTGSPEGKGPVGMDGQAGLPGSAGSPKGIRSGSKGHVVLSCGIQWVMMAMGDEAKITWSIGPPVEKGFVGMDGQGGCTGSPEGKGPVGMDGQAEVIGSTGSVEMAGGAIVAASGSQEQNGPNEGKVRRVLSHAYLHNTEWDRALVCPELCPVRHGSRQSPRVPECNVDLPQARFGTPTVCPKPYPCTVWDKAQLGHNSALPLTPMCGDA
ncbi:hypothetical protein Bbelb_133720 [Branchiostoma belcheri]|nr:hypothetical protein Bbelb_133720 [Branchiostoma belcheri]